MLEEFHVLVKKFDEIDTTSTGHVFLELFFADIITQFANLTEEAINSSLGFLVILLYRGPEYPCHASLVRAPYIILWSLRPRLYLRPPNLLLSHHIRRTGPSSPRPGSACQLWTAG